MSTTTSEPGIEQTVGVEHLFDMSIELEDPQLIATPLGQRVTYIIRSGTVAGPRLSGTLVPGGGDWLMLGADGVLRVDVRCTIRTDDEQLIFVTAGGVVQIPPDAMERYGAGERLSWEDLYARTTLLFETGAEAYSWLNGTATIAINEVAPNRVDYRVYGLR